jgi:hypothetical protein
VHVREEDHGDQHTGIGERDENTKNEEKKMKPQMTQMSQKRI